MYDKCFAPGTMYLSPVGVMVVVVVAAQSYQCTQTDGVGEEDLCACIHPHLAKPETTKLAFALIKLC